MRPKARVLALDLGKRRIGLAISDGLGLMAHGLETLERSRTVEDVERLAEVASARDVQLFLVGNPVHLSGAESRGSERAREFGQRLTDRTGIPVSYWDERLTSVEAAAILAKKGIRPEKQKGAVDRVAAILLLESYLESDS